MTAKASLILYTRTDCHLCELAAAMLVRAGVEWQAVDIDSDPVLAGEYGVHVPVVQHAATGKRLFFPFGDEQLGQFLGQFIESNPLGPESVPQ